MTTSSESDLDWTEALQWIGRNLVGGPVLGADPVERSAIRRQLEVLEMDCPLHYDDGVAKRCGHPGIIAPYHMLGVFDWGRMWEPGLPTRWVTKDPDFTIQPLPQGASISVPNPGTTAFVTDLESEYPRPLYVGDRVILTANTLVEVNPRKTRVGDGAFMTYESTYENQRGEIIGKTRMTLYSYVPNSL